MDEIQGRMDAKMQEGMKLQEEFDKKMQYFDGLFRAQETERIVDQWHEDWNMAL